ncbi:hypothetical protein GCM10010103_40100 [Streptomyces paradoxus]|uniref:Uncharacterized protein n=1 Tax=Streptomyces paradoxus TaxID=66375 RepID=A0A7W9WI11_9ACTN|nr:hypothetical protein [Streptomyces paradoxus]MBB6077734.1 hypothetical protein [Streptomyces paradoxus]
MRFREGIPPLGEVPDDVREIAKQLREFVTAAGFRTFRELSDETRYIEKELQRRNKEPIRGNGISKSTAAAACQGRQAPSEKTVYLIALACLRKHPALQESLAACINQGKRARQIPTATQAFSHNKERVTAEG